MVNQIYTYNSLQEMPSPVYLHKTNQPPTSAASQKIKLQPTTPISSTWVPEHVFHHHTHRVGPNQCSSAVVQTITAPIDAVWFFLRRFDNPQAYKQFLKSCHVVFGDGHVGSLREVQVVSGLPAGSSRERLEILDDERHVMSFSVVGGDHRLKNYKSVTTLHRTTNGNDTVVVESYVVDIPQGNTNEETVIFVDTIVRCNLQSLAKLAENLLAKKESKLSIY